MSLDTNNFTIGFLNMSLDWKAKLSVEKEQQYYHFAFAMLLDTRPALREKIFYKKFKNN